MRSSCGKVLDHFVGMGCARLDTFCFVWFCAVGKAGAFVLARCNTSFLEVGFGRRV